MAESLILHARAHRRSGRQMAVNFSVVRQPKDEDSKTWDEPQGAETAGGSARTDSRGHIHATGSLQAV